MSDAGSQGRMSGSLRRSLAARGNRMQARVTVGKLGLTDAVVAQIRREIERAELVKVRCDVPSAADADLVAREIAARIPCHLIQRVGRVALLYQPRPEAASADP